MDVFLKKYFFSFYLVVIAACTLLLGKSVATLLGASSLGTPRSFALPKSFTPIFDEEFNKRRDVEAILTRNIFCSNCEPIVPIRVEPESQKPVDTTPKRTSLPLQLVSLMVVDENWSFALIRDLGDEKKEANLYRRRDRLPRGQGTVIQVTDQRVYFLVGGRIEYLDISNTSIVPVTPTISSPLAALTDPGGEANAFEKEIEKGIRCSSPYQCEIDRSVLDKVLGNTASLVKGVNMIPAMKDGKPNGFKIYPSRTSTIWNKIGIQFGDIIKSINNLEMTSPDKALEAYAKLRTASHLTLVIERKSGETATLEYTIK